MRTLAFDGRMGASGDMLLGALLAAGADRSVLGPVEDALDVRYDVGTTTDSGISATTVDVRYAHDLSGGNGADDGHEHGNGEGETHAEGHGPHRSYEEVVEVVESIDLPAEVETDAQAIFEILAKAEAAVHGKELAQTHFHEVGADDAIADVVGVCLLLEDLAPQRVVTTPVAAGGGDVEMNHGTYPVPTPAVVEIAAVADWELRGGPVEMELLTPTGAAILTHVAEGVETIPSLTVTGSGYGAGDRTVSDRPNVLRALVGDSTGGLQRDAVTVLETNLDDASPELLGGLHETLSEAGALDVSIVPLTMKKSRPGHLVKVIVKPEDARQVARRLAEETGTLGVREHGAGHRWIADRELRTATITVDGTDHDVTVKVATADGDRYDVSTEYDDALAVARETDRPVREIMRRAEAAIRD